MTMDGLNSTDRILEALAHRLSVALTGLASVEIVDHPGLRQVSVTPVRSNCARVSYTYLGLCQVEVGSGCGGGRFELNDAATAQDVEFIEDVVDAAVRGRVEERFASDRWSKVVVTLASGEKVAESGGSGLPWPWLRRRVVRYQAYSD